MNAFDNKTAAYRLSKHSCNDMTTFGFCIFSAANLNNINPLGIAKGIILVKTLIFGI
ncbi:MAG: hypothetical protein QXK81_06875 [Candidatus Bathyarchaeia archaeon]